MRLLIALMEREPAVAVAARMARLGYDVTLALDGKEALEQLLTGCFDLALLHACLPRLDGLCVLRALRERALLCPPRVLFVCDARLCDQPLWEADCLAPLCAAPQRLCSLLSILSQKPLPKLAAAQSGRVARAVDAFLDELRLSPAYKGRAYAAWLLDRLIPSPAMEKRPMAQWYQACAEAFATTPAAVERCLRVAVESVFTQGSMRGIEAFFGATVDPERGKPTNRAFLMQAVERLRLALGHSLADTRSLNSSEMHQSPAAPTMV